MYTLLLFIFIILIVFFLLSLFKGVSRVFVRPNEQQTPFSKNKYTYDKSAKHQKVFGRNEGQYIQYEELKDQ